MRNLAAQGNLKAYVAGYVLSIALTILAFLLVTEKLFSHWILFSAVVTLGVLQAFIQLILFLHLGRESKPYWNLVMFFFMVSILVIIVLGTLWIMHHLNYNMMGMSHD